MVTARRRALKLLGDKKAVQVLFDEIAPRFEDRPGGADERLIELADLVTEMKEIKHPYSKGVLARKGIDC